MAPNELLDLKKHRDFTFPREPWKYYQQWNEVAFMHWPVEIDLLRNHIPKDIAIDTFDGRAWVSLVCFKMERIKLRNFPASSLDFGIFTCFDEINVRTYAVRNGVPGVYFLSIKAGKLLSAQMAKILSGLPYEYASMKHTSRQTSMVDSSNSDTLKVSYEFDQTIEPKSELDRWLTERYTVIQDVRGKVKVFHVHHPEWQLQQLTISEYQMKCQSLNDIQRDPELMHYSTGVEVLAW